MLSDPKELAEHLMLIDLGRNDVGRISKAGTVLLTEKMVVERYSHVMHMTSNVLGQTDHGVGPIDVLRATLPAGTLSGAPKIRAMQIIDELEPVKRNIYGGAVGYTTDPSFVPVAWAHPITAVYCGYKKPTPEVIEWVETRFKNDQKQLQRFYEQIHLCAEKGLRALLKKDEETLVQTLSAQQRVMNKMGLSSPEINEIVCAMEADPKVQGIKISGSGQGDCVIGLGRLSAPIGSYEIHELDVDPMGCVQVEIADPTAG